MDMTRPFAELVSLMEQQHNEVAQDKLDKITVKMREARDLKYEISSMEESVKSVKKKYNELVQRNLPDMMNEVSQETLRLQAEGNYPAFQFSLKPFYKANIENSNPNSLQAYRWLDEHGEGDIIKRTVTATLGKESEDKQKQLEEVLQVLKVDYDVRFGVPWNTLTAWLKERHTQYIDQQKFNAYLPEDERIDMPPLDIFGATIGQVVDMKEAK